MNPILMIVEPTHDTLQRALDTAVTGATLLVCGPTAATETHTLTAEAIREALKPSPVDHWNDALLDMQIPTLAEPRPRRDRQARRGSSGRIGRRDYAGRGRL